MSLITHSVVRSIPAIEAAFSSATRETLPDYFSRTPLYGGLLLILYAYSLFFASGLLNYWIITNTDLPLFIIGEPFVMANGNSAFAPALAGGVLHVLVALIYRSSPPFNCSISPTIPAKKTTCRPCTPNGSKRCRPR